MRVLSVDLGTSNTVAALAAHGRPPRVVEVDGSATMPSSVYAEADGTLLVGVDAERRARLDPSRFEPNPKHRIDEGTLLLGDAVVGVTEALGAVLRRVAEETSRQLGGETPDEVRLTHPAQWGPVRRTTLLSAARLAGFGGKLLLVPEPVAAAAHFAAYPGQHLPVGRALAVYDLGAGTFDCAVVGLTPAGFAVRAEDGLPDLGGLDVDQALLEHVGREVSHRDPGRWQRLLRPETTADRRAQRTLREDVRQAKEALSRHPQTEVPMPEPFDDVLVTRAELEALIRPTMLRSVELLAATTRAAGANPGELAGIYLVGGASRIPLAAALLAEHLKVVPTSLDQPETAVALGAHDVPEDGITQRTQEFARPTLTTAPPVSGPLPTPPLLSAPVSTPTGFPTPGGFAPQPPYPAYQPPYATQPQPPQPSQQPGKPRRGRRNLVIAAAAAVVVVLGVVGGLLLVNRNNTTVNAGCAAGASADAQGFVPCLRTLAGGVATNGKCQAGSSADASLTGLATNTVTCQLGSGATAASVVYMVSTSASAQQRITALVMPASVSLVTAQWQGNGLTGRYEAGVGDGFGVVLFTVQNSPMLGVLTRSVTSGGKNVTADAMADYFEQSVQPGT